MPRRYKSTKTVIIDTVLFFALIVLIGHLTINFWERYTIQSELSSMKHNLHTLKDTIANIGNAYDNLQNEIKDLFKIVDTKALSKPYSKLKSKQVLQCKTPHCLHNKELEVMRCKNNHNLDCSNLYETQLQTFILKPEITKNVGTLTNERKILKNKTTDPVTKDVAANTRNHPKSTGVTTNKSEVEKTKYFYHNSDYRLNRGYTRSNHRCYNNSQYRRHICNHVIN